MSWLAGVVGLHFMLVGVVGILVVRVVTSRLLGLRTVLGTTTRDGALAPLGRQLIVAAVGPLGAYAACSCVFAFALALGGQAVPTLEVDPIAGSRAEAAGIRAGDVVVAVEGQTIREWNELPALVRHHPEEPIDVQVRRGDRLVTLRVVPDGEGIIGVQSAGVQYHPKSLGSVLAESAALPATVVGRSLTTLARLLSYRVSSTVMGPVGIVAEAERAEAAGWASWMFLGGVLGTYGLVYVLPGDLVVVLAYLAERRRRATMRSPSTQRH